MKLKVISPLFYLSACQFYFPTKNPSLMEIWAISWNFVMSIHYVQLGNWKSVSAGREVHKKRALSIY
jgi:hypothetical protein